jgi:Domain of unknown function (DUF4314)
MMEEELQIGMKIELVCMPDDPDPLPVGCKGTVIDVQRLTWFTQVEVDWENGRKLLLSLPPDQVREISS